MTYPGDNKKGHAVIITSVDNGQIKYSGHSSDREDASLERYMYSSNGKKNFDATIVRMNDVIVQ